MYPISKYKFYKTNDNKTIAVSTYAGKTIKGVAKLDPRDEYNEEYGKELAAARCNLKVAKKRKARAERKVAEAAAELRKAYKFFDDMKEYEQKAALELDEAIKELIALQTEE